MEPELVTHDCPDLQLPYRSESREGAQSPRNMLWKQTESWKHALLKGNGQMFWLPITFYTGFLGKKAPLPLQEPGVMHSPLGSRLRDLAQVTPAPSGDAHTRPHPGPGNARTPEWPWDCSLQQQGKPHVHLCPAHMAMSSPGCWKPQVS